MRKNTYLETKNRQIEILKKYYEVDTENKKVTIPFNYEHASDMLYNEVSVKSPRFNDDIFTDISDIIKRVPIDYKVNVDFIVDDYGEYKPEEIMQSMNDGMELRNYSLSKDNKKKWILSAILVLVGFLVLFLKVIGVFQALAKTDVNKTVIDEIIDITGWVFIWEAVSTMFLSPSDTEKTAKLIKYRVSEFRFMDKKGKLVAKETVKEALNTWVGESRVKRLGKTLLLIGGIALIGIAIANIFTMIKNTYIAPEDEIEVGFIIFNTVFFVIVASFETIAGISAISRYKGYGPFIKLTGAFAIILSVILTIILVFVIMLGGAALIFSTIVGLIFAIIYAAGYFIDIASFYHKNKNSKKVKKA